MSIARTNSCHILHPYDILVRKELHCILECIHHTKFLFCSLSNCYNRLRLGLDFDNNALDRQWTSVMVGQMNHLDDPKSWVWLLISFDTIGTERASLTFYCSVQYQSSRGCTWNAVKTCRAAQARVLQNSNIYSTKATIVFRVSKMRRIVQQKPATRGALNDRVIIHVNGT